MTTVSIQEAQARLSELIRCLTPGEEVVITKHGKPVARLVGAQQVDKSRVTQAYEKLRALRKGTTLGGVSWKELLDQGRR